MTLTREKAAMWTRVLALAALLCLFLPTLKISLEIGFLGVDESESISGYKCILNASDVMDDLDTDSLMFGVWLGGAVVAGIVGLIAGKGMIGVLANVAGVVCLLFTKDEFDTVTLGLGTTDIGWTLSLVAFILAAVMALASCFLAGAAAPERTRSQSAAFTPGAGAPEPARSKDAASMSDADIIKLRDELKKFRVNDSDDK